MYSDLRDPDHEPATPDVAAAILLDERLDPLVAALRAAVEARRTEAARLLTEELAATAEDLRAILG